MVVLNSKLPPPYELFGEVDSGKGSGPSKKSNFFGPNRKVMPACPPQKTIALAFLEATYPQIPS